MSSSLEDDLAQLRSLAFRRLERCGDLLKRFHGAAETINACADKEAIWILHDWLLTPLSLWPIDFEGVARHVLPIIVKKRKLHPHLGLLLRLAGPPPGTTARDLVGAYEHEVARGAYEELVLQGEKFADNEKAVKADKDLMKVWRELKLAYRPGRYANTRGVIRRRMSQERNFREGWEFDWTSPETRFRVLFDALCYRWDLYGFENDQPLLLKLTVNPTPHGTMIVIPRHWSFDKRRDLNWKKIRQLHRAHGAAPQGPKASPNSRERTQEAQRALRLWQEAESMGLRGEAKYDHVKSGLKLNEFTDNSCVRRMVRRAKRSTKNVL